MSALAGCINIAKERIAITLNALLKHSVCSYCVLRALKVEIKRWYSLTPKEHLEAFRALELVEDVDWELLADLDRKPSCPVCLDCFPRLASIEFKNQFLEFMKSSGFEFADFGLGVTFPANLFIRLQSFQYFLQDHCGGYVGEPIRLKDSMKWPLAEVITSNYPNTKYIVDNIKSDFIININLENDLNTEESYVISPPPPNADISKTTPAGRFKKTPPPTYDGQKMVTTALNKMKKEQFLQKIPTLAPDTFVRCTVKMDIERAPFYVAGRYNKYSRNVSQSPWLMNPVGGYSLNNDEDEDGRIGETSTEELIVPLIKDSFIVSSHKFSAAGREDIDVRMLGRGRPFLIELLDAKRVLSNTPERLLELERSINASTKLIRVQDLQVVDKNMIMIMKDGESDKRKIYRALVELSSPVEDAVLEKLNAMGEFELAQKTPIRVLHRRIPLTRPKKIYSLKCERINSHFLYLDLKTQAGTYIKEFVHGDMGRTTPSLKQMLGVHGMQCDILLLDVMAVDLDFPPKLPNEPEYVDYPSMAKEMEEYVTNREKMAS